MPTILTRLTALVFVATGALPEAAKANPIAEVICAPSDQMRTRLESQYQAQRVWSGLRSPDEVMELWEEPSGDWSLTIAYAEGRRCIVAMGDALQPFSVLPQS